MAHFAKIENDIVTNVIVIDDTHETNGQDFINNVLKLEGEWIQTSYNTSAGEHKLGGTPLRKNYASAGSIYHREHDAFSPPKPYKSWVLNNETALWEPPTPMPSDGNWYWNDELDDWAEIIEVENN